MVYDTTKVSGSSVCIEMLLCFGLCALNSMIQCGTSGLKHNNKVKCTVGILYLYLHTGKDGEMKGLLERKIFYLKISDQMGGNKKTIRAVSQCDYSLYIKSCFLFYFVFPNQIFSPLFARSQVALLPLPLWTRQANSQHDVENERKCCQQFL